MVEKTKMFNDVIQIVSLSFILLDRLNRPSDRK